MPAFLYLFVCSAAATALIADEEREMASGRKLFVVGTADGPPENWFLIAETSGVVAENFGRPLMSPVLSKFGNLIFYQTNRGDFDENYEAFEEALEYTNAHFGKPVVVTYSGSGNVALHCLGKPRYHDAARFVLYTAGPGNDLRAQWQMSTEWLRARLQGSEYRALKHLIRHPMDSAAPALQFQINFAVATLFGALVHKCYVTGTLCIEVFDATTPNAATVPSFVLGLHARVAGLATDVAQYPQWFDGWVDAVDSLTTYAHTAPPIVAVHGAEDHWHRRDLTMASLKALVPGGFDNCTVLQASHVLWTENPTAVEACVAGALRKLAR